ncbi:MAG: DUF4340 domain-containing protein [Actinobacteria bacterium]|nr:MAG: DUF4340 domain-containing protein [Actinomycetota bacterium]
MSDKTIKNLAIVLVVLVAVFGLAKVITNIKQKPAEVKKYDFKALTKDLDKIEVEKGKEKYTLEKKGDKWTIGGKKADKTKVDAVVTALGEAKISEVASEKEADYSLYQVDNKAGTNVAFYSGGSKKGEFIIGKQGSDYQSFYLKLPDDKAVYTVVGNLSSSFNVKSSDWVEKAKK